MMRLHACFIVALTALLGLGVKSDEAPTISGCVVFPADNVWNARVDDLPVLPGSDAYVSTIGADKPLWPDFASGLYEGASVGIPYLVVPFRTPRTEIVFRAFDGEGPYEDESDVGPAPIPASAPIEGGPAASGDRHVLVIEAGSCTLFELYKAVSQDDGRWAAVGSVRFDLETNALRPQGMTSADAAGLPVFPGLVRYPEVSLGEIRHALRFTAPRTRNGFVWPARHAASDESDPALPPMGQRFRLKADVDVSGFSPSNRVILVALKRYGMILADNGSPWFLSGAPHDGWDNDDLAQLRTLTGSDFEAVDAASLMVEPDSAASAPR